MLKSAWIITRREIKDSLSDWRIVAPILILTLIFPWIMDLSTRMGINYIQQYQATLSPVRLVPFAMLIVGFFPISISLIIALESFVGEKERSSLEPLLTTPISDEAMYLGKLLSALLPPVVASYTGVGAYLLGLFLSIRYVPDLEVLAQILILTTVEALAMVAGAVVVSSHTTSVRAANLLASFIIIPMAFLLQGESLLLVWGHSAVLWCIVAGVVVADAILIRTGMRTFNREEILAREFDELNLPAVWQVFKRSLVGRSGFSPKRIYQEEMPALLRANRLPIALTALVVVGAVMLGWYVAVLYPLPGELTGPLHVTPDTFKRQVDVGGFGLTPQIDTIAIFTHNLRSLVLGAVLGLFSFGSLALILLLAPMGLVGFVAGESGALGTGPLTFLAAFIAPHGIFEAPAAILATAFALRLGASVISPPAGLTAGENLLHALADFCKVFLFLVIPLLFVAAFVEANVTPQVAIWLYGR